jgi:hypothetical protein
MSEAWLNFIVVIFIQFLLFIIHAYYEKKLSDAPRILVRGVLSGIVLGLLFELVLGTFFGLWSNLLGFGTFFLAVNVVLLYGLFAANTLLMQRARLAHFYIWTMIVAVVSEITNLFFHMFTWEFTYLSPIEYLIVLSAGYFGGAIFVAIISHLFFGHRFLFMDNLLKK